MDYYKFQSLDITRFVERYSGESLEDLFQNQKIIKNDMGEFLELSWEIADFPFDMNLQITRKNLISNLKTVYYIGENIETYLMNRKIRNLID